MSNMHKIGKTATTIRIENGYTYVKYHNTDVVKFNERKIILNSGGWLTKTTKNRMNQISNVYDFGYYVYQKNYKWFIDFKGETLEFIDGITLKG